MWRYSRINDLDLDAFAPAGPTSDQVPADIQRYLDAMPDRVATVIVANGRVIHSAVADRWAAKGLVAGQLDEEGLLGSIAGPPSDLLGELHEAFIVEPVLIDIPSHAVLDGPIVVADWSTGDGAATFPHVVVRSGEDSEATVVELQCSSGTTFSLPLTELLVGRAARLRHVTIQQLDLAAWQIARQVSDVAADATFVSSTAAFGGDYARLRTDCRLTGRGATGDLLAVYFGEGGQTLDFRTFQDHMAPDTTSNLLFKGAVGGRSRSVYTGLIKVEKEARGTNAFQTNRNIKLSEHAWAESVPNLQIETNDVSCSHASAVGPVDEDQLFYLESRGVPTDVAERLIVTGFFDEVLSVLPVPALAPILREGIAGKFDRREIA